MRSALSHLPSPIPALLNPQSDPLFMKIEPARALLIQAAAVKATGVMQGSESAKLALDDLLPLLSHSSAVIRRTAVTAVSSLVPYVSSEVAALPLWLALPSALDSELSVRLAFFESILCFDAPSQFDLYLSAVARDAADGARSVGLAEGASAEQGMAAALGTNVFARMKGNVSVSDHTIGVLHVPDAVEPYYTRFPPPQWQAVAALAASSAGIGRAVALGSSSSASLATIMANSGVLGAPAQASAVPHGARRGGRACRSG